MNVPVLTYEVYLSIKICTYININYSIQKICRDEIKKSISFSILSYLRQKNDFEYKNVSNTGYF